MWFHLQVLVCSLGLIPNTDKQQVAEITNGWPKSHSVSFTTSGIVLFHFLSVWSFMSLVFNYLSNTLFISEFFKTFSWSLESLFTSTHSTFQCWQPIFWLDCLFFWYRAAWTMYVRVIPFFVMVNRSPSSMPQERIQALGSPACMCSLSQGLELPHRRNSPLPRSPHCPHPTTPTAVAAFFPSLTWSPDPRKTRRGLSPRLPPSVTILWQSEPAVRKWEVHFPPLLKVTPRVLLLTFQSP